MHSLKTTNCEALLVEGVEHNVEYYQKKLGSLSTNKILQPQEALCKIPSRDF